MTDKLQALEETLQVKFEKYEYGKEQGCVYRMSGTKVSGLDIKNIVIDNLDVLLPFADELRTLRFINCTIGNIGSMSSFERLNHLWLTNVIIPDTEKPPMNFALEGLYAVARLHVHLENMVVEHPGIFLSVSRNIDHVFITNCIVRNFYEINLFPRLYDLRLTGVTIQQSGDDVIYKPIPDGNFVRLCLSEMTIENLDVFVPVSKNLTQIDIDYCTINSVRNIHAFTKLMRLDIDAATVIQDTTSPQDKTTSFHIDRCIVGDAETEEPTAVDLQNLGSIAHYIKGLRFRRYGGQKTDFLSHFSQLEALEFESSEAPLGDFLPVAHQIKTVMLERSGFSQSEHLGSFKQLEQIKVRADYGGENGVRDFKKLLPLRHQLKDFYTGEQGIKNLETIEEFTSLESLHLEATSAEEVRRILRLSSLKKLQLTIDIDPAPAERVEFDLTALKKMQELMLTSYSPVFFKGAEHLDGLKKLHLERDCKTDGLRRLKNLEYLYLSTRDNNTIDTVPAMESLKTLWLEVGPGYDIHSLEQFPNLEKLKIQSDRKVNTGKLEKLKILIAQWSDLQTTNCFDHLPNLEELDLQRNDISDVTMLGKLTNLRMLDLSENFKIENIDGLQNLQKLEYLNLFENRISDFSILNKLPNLKQVNVESNTIGKEEIQKQMNRPEIIAFLGPPYAPFVIRID